MSLWRQLTHGVRALTNRSETDRELADEVEHYIEQAAAAHMARGLSHAEAQRAARLELGGVTHVREEVRGYGWENAVETAFADARYAVRQLAGAPGFSTVAVLTLALGIGATTAIFSAVNPILFESLPYPHADRLMAVWELRKDGSRSDATFGMQQELAKRSRSFDGLVVTRSWQPAMTGSDLPPEQFYGQRVSARYFHVLGVAPALGRDFESSDDIENGPNVVILSDGLWRRRFQADPAIIGRAIKLNDKDYSVIGVMPAGFENVLAPSAEAWTTLQYSMSEGRTWGHHLRMVGRLRPNVTAAQATRELNVLGPAVLQELKPDTYGTDVEWSAVSLQDDVTRGVRPALLAVLGAVALVLVIACVNVTNLLLARAVQRRGEFALRAALGAGRRRLIRQLLTESFLLACIGGAVGLIVAILGVRALVALSPPGLPRVSAIHVDATAFAFALAITTVVGLVFGLIPALQAARSNPQTELQHASKRTAGGHRRTRNSLVVAEVALALVLLVGSGLLLRSLERLFAISPGFDSAGVLTMQVQRSGLRMTDDSTIYRFFAQALDEVRRVPGVDAAAFTSQLPLSGDFSVFGVHFESSPAQRADEDHSAFRYAVSPGYIETMRIPLRRGRSLDARDHSGTPLVALINESYARREFPGMDAIGQRLRIGAMDGPLYTIVGIVADVKQMSLALSQSDAVYIPSTQSLFADNSLSLVVRTRGGTADLTPAIRQAIWSVDKDQPLVRVATMADLLAASAAERRFALILFEAFALAALALAAAGIYGVLAGSVAERTREIGVRAALGATRANILALIARQGMKLIAVGAALGLAGAVAASQAIASMLFGVSRLDPVTYAGVSALLLVVSAVACWIPAWRAARVDPAITLRAE